MDGGNGPIGGMPPAPGMGLHPLDMLDPAKEKYLLFSKIFTPADSKSTSKLIRPSPATKARKSRTVPPSLKP
jgi:hypothetical protein